MPVEIKTDPEHKAQGDVGRRRVPDEARGELSRNNRGESLDSWVFMRGGAEG